MNSGAIQVLMKPIYNECKTSSCGFSYTLTIHLTYGLQEWVVLEGEHSLVCAIDFGTTLPNAEIALVVLRHRTERHTGSG